MRKKIPWEYSDTTITRIWQWKTPHFEAQVQSDGSRFFYKVDDLTRGRKIQLLLEMGSNFQDCENNILEFVSKSYPFSLGYRDYAGELATTFRINDGSLFDFGPYEGSKIRMKVKTDDGDEVITGSMQVRNHELEVAVDGNGTIRVPPIFVMNFSAEFSDINDQAQHNSIRRNRTVKGQASKGCTGQPGFVSGTVVHSLLADWCPVHRI